MDVLDVDKMQSQIDAASFGDYGPWFTPDLKNGYSNVVGEQPLQLRAEGPYVRVRGCVIRNTAASDSCCRLPGWASPFGGQICSGPVTETITSGGANALGVARVYGSILSPHSEGGAVSTNKYHMNFRYLRSAPNFAEGARTSGSNNVSIYPWVTYGNGSTEWLAPSLVAWNGVASMHGLANGGTAPTSDLVSLYNSVSMNTIDNGIAIKLLIGVNQVAGYPGVRTVRADVNSSGGGAKVAGLNIHSNLWVSLSGVSWVNGTAQTSMIAPTLLNSWTNYPGYQPITYTKIDDVVFIQGLAARSGGSTLPIFNLPVGYRPPSRVVINNLAATFTAGNEGIGSVRMAVETNGDVHIDTGLVPNGAYLSLDLNYSVTP